MASSHTNMSFEEYIKGKQQVEGKRDPHKYGRIKLFVGPARSSKTGQLWLEKFRLYEKVRLDHEQPAYQAFHFAEQGFGREHALSSLMLKLDLKPEKQLTVDEIELLKSLYESRLQTITNEPLDESMAVENPYDILQTVEPRTEVVFIDDAHLFDGSLVTVCEELAKNRVNVILAGWKLSPSGEPISTIGELICLAEEVISCHGVCAQCTGSDPPATYTQRLYGGKPVSGDFISSLSLTFNENLEAGALKSDFDEKELSSEELYSEERFEARCGFHFQTPPPDMKGQLSLVASPTYCARASLTVIVGPMFGGKTRELLLLAEQEALAGYKVAFCKVVTDDRDDQRDRVIQTHPARVVSGQLSIEALPIGHPREILSVSSVEEASVVVIDRAQFLSGLYDMCVSLLYRGKRLIVSGIDLDFAGRPFNEMPKVLCLADYIVKLRGICRECGSPWGSRTQRYIAGDRSQPAPSSDPIILLGDEGNYETRCRHCHVVE